MLKKKSYSHYTKKELIEELHLMIDNYNSLEWQLNNQAKYINQNHIPIEWVNMWLENNSKTVINPDYYDWKFTQEPIDYYVTIYPHEVKRMLNDWEKENGIE